MTAELRRGLMLAGIGVVGGLAVVAAYVGTGDLLKRARPAATDETARQDLRQEPQQEPRRAADLPGSGTAAAPRANESSQRAAIDPLAHPGLDPGTAPDAASGRPPQAGSVQDAIGQDTVGRDAANKDAGVPTLDIVRVEPSGDTVIAGRGAPNAAVELLRDNRPVARVVADDTGQFAIVPPPLPTGNSAITLRATSPDGRTVEGRESVAVVVASDRKTQALVAVSEPDKATRVLSQPGAPDQGRTAALDKDGNRTAAPEAGRRDGGSGPVRVVSVDAQDGGRLFVSGQGAAWSSLRLYLNDTLVASGRSGADGRIAFTIGRGVRPGNYQVRIDQVEGESGRVHERAQVAFAFPAQLAAKEPAKEPIREPMKAPIKLAEHRAHADRPNPEAKPAGTIATREAPAPNTTNPAGPLPRSDGLGSTKPDARASAGVPASTTTAGSVPVTPPPRVPPVTSPSTLAQDSPPPEPKSGEQAGAVFVPEIDTARIIRGDNLWQISRRTYGDGKRYTVIYDANREQIRDPDLIYPGQIFVMPKDMQGEAPRRVPAADRQGSRRG